MTHALQTASRRPSPAPRTRACHSWPVPAAPKDQGRWAGLREPWLTQGWLRPAGGASASLSGGVGYAGDAHSFLPQKALLSPAGRAGPHQPPHVAGVSTAIEGGDGRSQHLLNWLKSVHCEGGGIRSQPRPRATSNRVPPRGQAGEGGAASFLKGSDAGSPRPVTAPRPDAVLAEGGRCVPRPRPPPRGLRLDGRAPGSCGGAAGTLPGRATAAQGHRWPRGAQSPARDTGVSPCRGLRGPPLRPHLHTSLHGLEAGGQGAGPGGPGSLPGRGAA